MKTPKIEDKTVKEIFEKLLGPENAKEVLAKIQAKFDEKVTVDELREFAKDTIEKITDIRTERKESSIGTGTAVTTGGVLTIQ